MKVRIALLVGSNGRAAASELEGADWGLLADCIMDWPEKGVRGDPKDPEFVKKYVVEVEVPLPAVEQIAGITNALISEEA